MPKDMVDEVLDEVNLDVQNDVTSGGDDDNLFHVYHSGTNWEIYLSDELDDSSHSYNPLLNVLNSKIQKGDTVNWYMSNSGGGVDVGQRICYAMKRCKGHITVRLESVCLSAGSLIALSGDALEIAKDAYLHFHGGSGQVKGHNASTKVELEARSKWCYDNDIEFCYPFLTKDEIDYMNENNIDMYIHGDDPTLKARIKRHFKKKRK